MRGGPGSSPSVHGSPLPVALGLIGLALLTGGCDLLPGNEPAAKLVGSMSLRTDFSPTAVPQIRAIAPDAPALTSLLNAPLSFHYGNYLWKDADVTPGKLWILVDLRDQTLSVFRGGNEIGRAVILYGTDGHPTPTGRFTVLERSKDHVSRTYDNAPMPYTLRLTTDGVAIHGSDVRAGAGTHGCIGVPKDFGSRLFDVAAVGDEVVILPAAPDGAGSLPPARKAGDDLGD